MTRYVKTVTASGQSSGGGAGLSAADVCATIDTYLPKYTGQVGLTTTVVGRKDYSCTCTVLCDDTADNTSNYPGTDSGLQYATASAGDQMGNWFPLAVCNCWTCCYCDCACIEFSLPSHCYDAFIIRFNGVRIKRCCTLNFLWSWGTESCYSKGQSWSSGNGCNQWQYCWYDQDSCGIMPMAAGSRQYMPATNWNNVEGTCRSTDNEKMKAIWINGSTSHGLGSACYTCFGYRNTNIEFQFWRYNNHMSGSAWTNGDFVCNTGPATTLSDGTCYICAPHCGNGWFRCQNEAWAMGRSSFYCCSWKGWRQSVWQPQSSCWCSCAGRQICWNDCCPQCEGRQFSKFILYPCREWLPHLTSYCCSDYHLNYHASWCVMGLNKCVPGFEGETPTGQGL